MTKKLSFIVCMLLAAGLHAQEPSPALVTGNSDFIGTSGWPYSQYLVEAGPKSFYWTGGTYNASVYHSLLPVLSANVQNFYFIKYDENANPLYANYIQGTYYTQGAFSFNGDFTVMGNASTEVVANGNVLSLDTANRLEFLASYNDRCQFRKIVSIWNLGPSQYPNSIVQMDRRSGALFVAGTSYRPFYLVGYGMIGEDYQDYLYVIKYDHDLNFVNVFIAGLVQEGEYGYYRNLRLVPAPDGGVVVAGTYEGDRSPIINGDTLTSMMMESLGAFAFRLDGGFKVAWLQEGNLKGYDYNEDNGISEGFFMKNGDLVLVGGTSTGSFQLGPADFTFENGSGYTNLFVYRLGSDGSLVWRRPFRNMGESYGEGKGAGKYPGAKGTEEVQSDEFSETFQWDAIQWKEKILYLTSTFLSDSFEVAGRTLEKPFYSGIFVAAVDMDSGEEEWGYALSTDYPYLYGFDLDASGNVSVMSQTGYIQNFEQLGLDSVPGIQPLVHFGLQYDGTPLWYNYAFIEGPTYGANGSDLEVLRDGEIFSAMYKSTSDALMIGGSRIQPDFTYCSVLAALDADNALGGTIRDKSGTAVYPGMVKAYKSTRSGAYPAVDSVMVNETGNYLFESLYPATYTLLAIPDKVQYPDGMPTYSGGAISWDDAQAVPVTANTRATFLDITLSELPKLTPEDGSGQMSGNVSYEEETALKGTAAKPVTRTSVILIKKASSKGTLEDDVVAYVETDDLGNYVFENVPDGEYILIVDIPGLPMIQTYEVVIEGNMIVSGLDFTVGNEGIDTSGTVDVENISMERISVYPNPGHGLLFMELPLVSDYRIRIYNSTGMLVGSWEYSAYSGLLHLDVSHLQTGIYLLSVEGGSGTETMKYLLK